MPLAKQRTASDAGRCYKCQAQVIWARIRDGAHLKPIAIERCRPGSGSMAILTSLFGDGGGTPHVEEVTIGTSYRRHDQHCPGPRSFSGTARARKLQWKDGGSEFK